MIVALCLYLYLVGALSSLAGVALLAKGDSVPVTPKFVTVAAILSFAWPVSVPYLLATYRE